MKIVFKNGLSIDIDSASYQFTHQLGYQEYAEDRLQVITNKPLEVGRIVNALDRDSLSEIKIINENSTVVYKGFTSILDASSYVTINEINSNILIGYTKGESSISVETTDITE